MSRSLYFVSPVQVTRPYLITLWTSQMVGHPLTVRAQAETVGQPFTELGERARIRPVQVHTENLPPFISDHLHQQPFV